MRKNWLSLTTVFLVIALLVGCGNNSSNSGNGAATNSGGGTPTNAGNSTSTDTGSDSTPDFKVGMVTDAGTIDDKSFNQGAWEGVVLAQEDLGLDVKYLKPAGTTEADYLNEIANLYDAGFKFIVTPGFKFETAIFAAQDKYPDAKFVLIDGEPRDASGASDIKENTVAIYYAEHESGFIAGVAAAVHIAEGDIGFIGGMKIPPVQKFNWGFQQGVQYANDNYGTSVAIKEENVIYQGSFDDVAAGGQLAAQMYDKGVKVIFAAAGGVGVGAINEAKTRALAGEEVWIIGVDVDQYSEGIYGDGDEKSIILTSAMKKITSSTFDMIKAEVDGSFTGGQIVMFDAKNNGVGIPEENPNLSEDAIAKAGEVFAKIKNGEISVAAEQGELIE